MILIKNDAQYELVKQEALKYYEASREKIIKINMDGTGGNDDIDLLLAICFTLSELLADYDAKRAT